MVVHDPVGIRSTGFLIRFGLFISGPGLLLLLLLLVWKVSFRLGDILGLDCLKRKFKELSDSEITTVLEECDYDVLEAAPKLQKVEYEKLKKIVEDMRNTYENETLLSGIKSPHILISTMEQNEKELQAKESSDEDLSINDLGEGEVETIRGKDPINEKSNTDDILYKKFEFLESDMSDLRKTDLEWEKLRILYEVDATRYGFIFADCMFESAMILNPFVSVLLNHDDWILEFDRVISLYTNGCIRDITEFGTIYKLSSDICDNKKNLNEFKSLMGSWLEKDFKDLKTKVHGYCITTTITEPGDMGEHNPKDAAEEEKNRRMDSSQDSASEVGLVQQPGDDTEFSDEKPMMRYFATQKELLKERKATLLHLLEEFTSECGFIFVLYNIGVLGPLQKKFRKLSTGKKIWTLDEVRVVYDSAKEAQTLLLFEDVDEDVSKFANLGDRIEELEGKGSFEVRRSVERIRVWVGDWVHKSTYVTEVCFYFDD